MLSRRPSTESTDWSMPPGPVPGGFLTRRLPPWFPMNWAHCAADEPKIAIINGFWNFNTKRGDWIFPPNHPSNCTMIAFQARTGSKHARRTIVPITAKTRSCKRSAPPLPRPRPARRRTRPHRAARKQGLPRQRKNGPPAGSAIDRAAPAARQAPPTVSTNPSQKTSGALTHGWKDGNALLSGCLRSIFPIDC